MIHTDAEFEATLDRILWFQQQVAHLRKTETLPANYRVASAGFLAEIDRMRREVREFRSFHPKELTVAA